MSIKLLFALLFSEIFFLPYACKADSWVQYTKCGIIYSIIQDGQNYWVGTDAGLVEVDTDGVPEKFFNCADSDIKNTRIGLVWKDNSRNTWISGDQGIAKYDGVKWTHFDYAAIGFHTAYLKQVAVDKTDKMWFTGSGLRTFDGSTWNTFSNVDSFYSVAVDTEDVKWIGTGNGLVRISGSDYTQYDMTNSNIPGNNVFKVTVDLKNNVWMLVSNYLTYPYLHNDSLHLVRFDRQSFINYATVPVPLDLLWNSSFNLEIDSNNNQWIVSIDGVFKYNGSSWSVNSFGGPLLGNHSITSSLLDKNGTLWIGFDNDTLLRYNSRGVNRTSLSNSKLPFKNFNCFFIDSRRTKWFGCVYGLVTYNDTTWSYYNYSNSPLPNCAFESAIADKDNNIWAVMDTAHNLFRFDGKNWNWVEYSTSPVQTAYSIAQDLNGNIWIGCADIYSFNGSTWTTHSPVPVSNYSNRDVCVDRMNNVWASSMGGLAKFNGSTWTTYTSSNSPISRPMKLAVDSSNNLWGGSLDQNLFRFDGNNWTIFDSSQIGSTGDGPIFVDKKGFVWVSTSKGVAMYDGTDWNFPFRNGSGLPNNNGVPLGEDLNGDMWFSTSTGFAVLKANPITGASFKNTGKAACHTAYKNKAFVFSSNNVSIDFNQHLDAKTVISICDISGRKIGIPTISSIGANKFKVQWNGRNSSGKKVSQGIYFFRFSKATMLQGGTD